MQLRTKLSDAKFGSWGRKVNQTMKKTRVKERMMFFRIGRS